MFYSSADISVTRRRSYTFYLLYDADNVQVNPVPCNHVEKGLIMRIII